MNRRQVTVAVHAATAATSDLPSLLAQAVNRRVAFIKPNGEVQARSARMGPDGLPGSEDGSHAPGTRGWRACHV
jgi:hypothetical protein